MNNIVVFTFHRLGQTLIFGTALLISCNSPKTPTSTIVTDTTAKTFVLTDSSRAYLKKTLDTIIKSNSTPDDVTISGRFIKQGNLDNGDSYITVNTRDSSITLINPMPLKGDEIIKLKKEGNNITLTYNSTDKTVKFLITNFELEK